MSHNPFEHKPPPISLLLKQMTSSDTADVLMTSTSETTTKLIEKQPVLLPTSKSSPNPSPFSNIESEVETTIVPLVSKESGIPSSTSILYTQPIVDTDISLDRTKVKDDSSCWCSISSLCCILLILLILITVGYYLYRWYYRTDIIVTKPEDETQIESEIESTHITEI